MRWPQPRRLRRPSSRWRWGEAGSRAAAQQGARVAGGRRQRALARRVRSCSFAFLGRLSHLLVSVLLCVSVASMAGKEMALKCFVKMSERSCMSSGVGLGATYQCSCLLVYL